MLKDDVLHIFQQHMDPITKQKQQQNTETNDRKLLHIVKTISNTTDLTSE